MRAQRRLIALVVTLGVLVAAALAGSAGARPGTSVVELLPEVEGLPRALAVQEQNTASLLDIDGVVGAGVGASATGEAVIKVYAESAFVAGVPDSVDGIPVDVEVTGLTIANGAPPPSSRFARPVPTGSRWVTRTSQRERSARASRRTATCPSSATTTSSPT